MAKAYKDVCPCKDCQERQLGCHGKCIKYKKWKENGIEIEKRQKSNFINFGIINWRKK